MSFSAFLTTHRERVEALERDASETWWGANTASSPEAEQRAGEAQKALSRVYADPAAFSRLKSYAGEAGQDIDSARQHALLHNAFLGSQRDDAVLVAIVDTERRVESAFNTYRPVWNGEPLTENAVRAVLRGSNDDGAPREAWEAGKSIGGIVAPEILELVTLRNREARRLGFPDHYHLALHLQEIEPAALDSVLREVEAATNAPFAAYKSTLDASLAARFGIAAADLRAHHYGDPFFQEAPAGGVDLDGYFADKDLVTLAATFFDAIGLEVRDILARSDLYERPAKSQHAFALHVGRFSDVRILCNLRPTEQWMGTLLHELGHAVYDKYLGDDLPFFLRDTAHILVTEAIAMLMGRFSRNAAWLTRYAGVPLADSASVAAAAARDQSAQLLIMARWCLVMSHFERALYSNPAQDLNALWWRLVARFQGIRPPDDRTGRADWASKMHLALAPVYYHNYLLGEMLASQLLDRLRATVAPTDSDLTASPALGAFLRQAVFAHGARHRWDRLIESATGSPLTATAFVGHLRLD